MKRAAFCFFLVLLGGCGNSRDPAGPDTMPIFRLDSVPAQVSPQQMAILSLVALLPDEFADLQNRRVRFTSSSINGVFINQDSSQVDINSPSGTNLSPSIWYTRNDFSNGMQDTIYAHCVDEYNEVLAWDSCTVAILP